MNGYQFVEKILNKTNQDVEPLIKLANGETEWLELKAALLPKDGQFHPNKKGRMENEWDYRLDVSKALFALANGIGGAVLLGVAEDKASGTVVPVGLEASGFSGDRDVFMLNLSSWILHPECWKTGQEGKWICVETHDQFRPVWGHFQGHDVVIILVMPRQKPEGWLKLGRSDDSGHELILLRQQGDIGRNRKFRVNYDSIEDENRLAKLWSSRQIDRLGLQEVFVQFLEDWTKNSRNSDEVFSEAFAKYHGSLINEYKNTGVDKYFVSLDVQKHNADLNNYQNESLSYALRKNKQLVLLGDPGSGKSTCLLQYANTLINNSRGNPQNILLIPLQEYSTAGLQHLLLKNLPRLNWQDLEFRIAKGEIILLLDALNECPSVYYEHCYQEISEIVREFTQACIVITSRSSLSIDFEIPVYDLQPLDLHQKSSFLDRYMGNANEASMLSEKLDENQNAAFFGSNPILLKMVADIWRENQSIPNGIAILYREYLEAWYQRENSQNKKIGSPPLWPMNRFLDALAELAINTRKEGSVSCLLKNARAILTGLMGDQAQRFIDRVAQGLLIEMDEEQEYLSFSHETIQEYLTAEYLVRNPSAWSEIQTDSDGKMAKSASWILPLVFALELESVPSNELLDSAWLSEPLFVSTALRDDKWFAHFSVYKHEDLWIRGVLKAMQGGSYAEESRELSLISHTPPKYKINEMLVASLRSPLFWHAGKSHSEGQKRLKRLEKLLLDRNSVWIELLPHALAGNPELSNQLSLAQKKMIGVKHGTQNKIDLEEATLYELCTLFRIKKISPDEFLLNWENALERRASDDSLETDLLVLLRTKAKLKSKQKLVSLSGLPERYRDILAKLGRNWNLSPRLVNVLVIEGILSPTEIRRDKERINDLVGRISAMNAFRLLKSKILKKDDFKDSQLQQLINEMNPEWVKELRQKRLINDRQILNSKRMKIFSKHDLSDVNFRKKILDEVVSQQWNVKVTYVAPENNFGFVTHERFDGDIFFLPYKIKSPEGRPIRKGDRLTVGINIEFSKKKDEWGFKVISGKFAE